MFESEHKDKQVEFFNDYTCMSKKPRTSKLALGKIALSLSYENVIIVSIGLIMILIVCYSLGVEKGKYLAKLSTDVDVIAIKAEPTPSLESAKTENLIKEVPLKSPIKETTKPKDEPLPTKTAEEKKAPAPQEKKVKIKIANKQLYTIQVATFRQSTSVQKETDRLKKIGYSSFPISSNKLTALCIGNYKSKGEASKDLVKLKKLYSDCYVRLVKK
ncbi:MAG: SPOR domain-containing protein [Candidatus Omnitrophota bacterium]